MFLQKKKKLEIEIQIIAADITNAKTPRINFIQIIYFLYTFLLKYHISSDPRSVKITNLRFFF